MTLAKADSLPAEAARRVVPSLCREAMEAACMESVRHRRLGKGQPHAEVEALLLDAQKLTNLAALALFDDPARAADVMTRINKEGGRSAGDTIKACNEGAHGNFNGVLVDFIHDAQKLAGWMRDRFDPGRSPRSRLAGPHRLLAELGSPSRLLRVIQGETARRAVRLPGAAEERSGALRRV